MVSQDFLLMVNGNKGGDKMKTIRYFLNEKKDMEELASGLWELYRKEELLGAELEEAIIKWTPEVEKLVLEGIKNGFIKDYSILNR